MPIITSPSRQMGNSVVTEFVDSVGTQEVTYSFPDSQEFLKVVNNGDKELQISVGSQTAVFIPAYQEVAVESETFSSFTIKSASGFGSFKISASFDREDEEDERKLAEQLEEVLQQSIIVIANQTDDTENVQNAIDSLSQYGGGTIFIKGVCVLKAKYQDTFEAGQGYYAVNMKSNVSIIGVNKSSGFKLADNESSDANPKYFSIFYSNQHLENIQFKNLLFDMNEANNKISPNRASGVYNRYLQSAIMFSTINGKCDDLLIEDCTFKDHTGTTVIGLGQSNTNGMVLGKNNIINRCKFENCGTDTDDHSTIYGWADDVKVTNCTFELPTVRNFGWTVAHEIHGANAEFSNNIVKNYFQGLWVGINLTSDVDRVLITNNIFSPIVGCAVDFIKDADNQSHIRNVDISNNFIGMTGDVIAEDIKVAIKVAPYRQVSEIYIHNNVATIPDYTKTSAFILLACNYEGDKLNDIHLSDNKAVNFNLGVYVTAFTGNVGYATIKRNIFKNLNNSTGLSMGVALATSTGRQIEKIEITDNSFVDDRPVSMFNFGIRTECTVDEITADNNTYSRMINGDYVEAILNYTRKFGAETRTMAAPPSTGTWKTGDKVYNSNPAAGGYEGWIYTNLGVWKGFGLIQP